MPPARVIRVQGSVRTPKSAACGAHEHLALVVITAGADRQVGYASRGIVIRPLGGFCHGAHQAPHSGLAAALTAITNLVESASRLARSFRAKSIVNLGRPGLLQGVVSQKRVWASLAALDLAKEKLTRLIAGLDAVSQQSTCDAHQRENQYDFHVNPLDDHNCLIMPLN